MSGFTSVKTPLTVFQVDNPAAVTVDALKKHAFRDIEKGEETSAGWTSIVDMLDTSWKKSDPVIGDRLCFALRVDKRRIQGAVLKKCCMEAARDLEATGTKLSRKRRKELKENIKARLLTSVEAAPVALELVLNKITGKLFVAGTSAGMLKKLAERMFNDFGVCLAPYEAQADTQRILRGIYDDQVSAAFDGHTYILTETGQTTLCAADDAKRQIVARHDRTSVDAGLTEALSFASLAVHMECEDLQWEFIINAKLVFSSLKTPAVKKDSANPDAALLEKLYLMEQAVGVVHTLFEAQPAGNS
ncbi:MAG: recombination-associated protein RdgC [Desulfovibrio sp.]|jgi:hypothetical protein|nr:recombination-associated protein RdgC [Desulfovibrio sp.]